MLDDVPESQIRPNKGVLLIDPYDSAAVVATRFREVLGQFPTGVAVVTAMDDQGQPIGMTVGSFTSVSLHPPLVAFLPDKSSSSFPAIRDAARFCVNVLAGAQESICRTFATRVPDRFAGVRWAQSPQTGSPVLEGAVAWIDCELGDVFEAGDHYIVIGRVLDLETAKPTLPLVFFQGGYGTFAPRSLVLASRGRPSAAVRAAEQAREHLERLSSAVGLECRAVARQDDGLVVVATVGNAAGANPVGVWWPYCPPFGATIAASGSAESRSQWYNSSPKHLEAEQRAAINIDLDEVRERGWALTFRTEAVAEVEEIVGEMAEYGRTPSLQRQLSDAGQRLHVLHQPSALNVDTAKDVATLSAPVLDADGPLLHLALFGFPPDASLEFVERARNALVATARTLSTRLGGRP